MFLRFSQTLLIYFLLFSYVESAESGGMPQLNPEFWFSQIFWLIITFGIMFILLSKLVLPKISENLEVRKVQISENIESAEKQREERPISDLWISVKCGESDTTSGLASNPTVGNLMDKLEPLGVHLCFGETSELTGAETVCEKRGKTPEAQEKFKKTWNAYNDFILKEATDDLSESQPTAGNIAGGLTTIEEKAFGNFQKIGSRQFIDVLEPAEEPTKGPGLYFMDTSSAAAECVTLQAAGGFNIHLFPTGQGNIIGNPIEPVIKLTANPLTAKTMSEHIDVDVSKILSREMNLDQAGDELIKATLRVANGRLTCAEALGHKEFVMTKLYRSA